MSTHVLVVDDDPHTRNMLTALLVSARYTVHAVKNGMEALAEIERERPSLMLLDMNMPVLDGWGVAQQLRERNQWVPTVVMTAAYQAMRISAEIGAQGYVNKPFDIDDLLTVVERVRSQRTDGGTGR